MSKNRRGLGSGLSILLGEAARPDFVAQQDATGDSLVMELLLDHVFPNPNQPRKTFDEESLAELASSITIHGVLQPILVTKEGDERFVIVAGERRYRSARKAGLSSVPAILLKGKTAEEQYQISILENIQRQNLNPIEEAEAYRYLIDNFGYTHEQLAERLNKSRSYITNSLRTMKLPESVKDMLVDGSITQGHAKVLSGVADEDVSMLAKKIAERQMSVRELEHYVKDKKIKEPKPDFVGQIKQKILNIGGTHVSGSDKNAILAEIAHDISDMTGYRTNIHDDGSGVRMTIDIVGVRDLAKMVDMMIKGFDG